MKATDSSPAPTERLPSNITAGFHARLASQGVANFRPERLLSEPNRVDRDQTQVYTVNGASSALRIRLDQFLLSVPPAPQFREYFRAMQKWEGNVIEVGQDTFLARLVRIVGEGPDQEAEIYVEEVDPGDRVLIEPGAVFYWSIGYLDRPSGRLRASVLRFRRLRVWTRRELEKADAEAQRLRGLLNVD